MTSLQAAIDDFLRVLAVEENVSPNTVRAYAADLNQLAQSLAARSGTAVEDLTCAALDRDAVRAFMVERLKAAKRSSAARKLSAVKRFARHLLRSGALTVDPCTGIQAPRQDKPLPAHLPVDDMFRLLAAPLPDTAAGLRDRALLEVAYSCGLRVSELVGLDLEAGRKAEARKITQATVAAGRDDGGPQVCYVHRVDNASTAKIDGVARGDMICGDVRRAEGRAHFLHAVGRQRALVIAPVLKPAGGQPFILHRR